MSIVVAVAQDCHADDLMMLVKGTPAPLTNPCKEGILGWLSAVVESRQAGRQADCRDPICFVTVADYQLVYVCALCTFVEGVPPADILDVYRRGSTTRPLPPVSHRRDVCQCFSPEERACWLCTRMHLRPSSPAVCNLLGKCVRRATL